VSLGSGVLVLVNILSINLAVLVGLWYQGYRPEHWFREGAARTATIQRLGVLVVSILILSAFLGGVTLDSYNRATTDERIQAHVEGAVDPPARVLDVTVEQSNAAIFREPQAVVVTVGVPPDNEQQGLAAGLDSVVDDAAGRDVTTEVRYVVIERQ
jgi:uncharacterized membrane protein